MGKQMEEKRFNKLLNRAKTDEKAFDELYSFYYKRIVHDISSYAGRDIACDVAQIFFLGIIQRKKPFKYICYPTAWVYTCCRNIAKKIALKEEKYLFDENIDVRSFATNESDTTVDFEWPDTVYPLISGLDETTEKILYLLYVKGYTLKEIAVITGVKYAAVRKRHSRALKHLREKLKGEKDRDGQTAALNKELFERGN